MFSLFSPYSKEQLKDFCKHDAKMGRKEKENKSFLYSSAKKAKTDIRIERERLLPKIPQLRLPPKA